jgi:Tfp pilus assembly protein PilN
MRSVVIAGLLLILTVAMYAGAKTFFNNSQNAVQGQANTTLTQALS